MTFSRRFFLLIWSSVLSMLLGCVEVKMETLDLDEVAESFVKLALAVGLHDADYVDAYFGPEEWRQEVVASHPELSSILEQALELRALIDSIPTPAAADPMTEQRHKRLAKTVDALIARVRFLQGDRLPFDQESLALFDAQAPRYRAEHFQAILDQLDALLPGDGEVIDQYSRFKQDFVIPPERLDAVFRAAVDACRDRTRTHLDLPVGETFSIEYVTDKSWSGYNWYQGDYRSLIQVNTDLPIYIDRALDLACHEGYPGHHVYNLLLERDLLRQRGFSEFYVYPLFSPRSLIAEGTANFGIEVAFPATERERFEITVLFPMAGLDPARVTEYYAVESLVDQLSYAGNEAARGYLDGTLDEEEAVDWLMFFALMPEARARQRLDFIEQYRSYVINYNFGEDLVRSYIEKQGGTADNPERRWQLFADLLSNPYLPSQLQ